MGGYKLYTYFKSTTAWRSRIALNLKQIKPEYVFVDLLHGKQKSEEYLKVNPNHGVPTLITPNGNIIYESMAIIEYLNEKYKSINDYFPGDPEFRAKIRTFCEVINSDIHPYQNLRLLEKINEDYNADKIAWGKYWTNRGVSTLEKILVANNSSGKYVFGDQITAADILFYPQVTATKVRWGNDLSQYPNVTRILHNLQSVK